jgi:hypothetical protein
MKPLIIKAFSIAVPYSIIMFVLSSIFSAHVQTFDQDGNVSGTLSGISAIIQLVSSNGVFSYLQFIAPNLGMFFIFILGALLIQGAIYERIKNS